MYKHSVYKSGIIFIRFCIKKLKLNDPEKVWSYLPDRWRNSFLCLKVAAKMDVVERIIDKIRDETSAPETIQLCAENSFSTSSITALEGLYY